MSTPNIILLIMLVIGVILTISGISMIFSDMIKDPVNNLFTMMLPLIIGIVLIGISASFGIKKVSKFLPS